MSRVVVITQVAAWPARSGMGRRVEAVVEAMAAEHEVAVVSCLPPGEPSGDPPVPSHERLARPLGRAHAVPRMLSAMAHRLPLTTAYYTSRQLRRELKKTLDALSPDRLVVHGVGGAVLVSGLFPKERTLLDLADAEHERVGALGRSKGWRGLPYRLDTRRVAEWIARELTEYAAVSVVSPQDLASYASLAPRTRLLLCPNGCTVRQRPRPDPGGTSVLFLGDLEYAPNLEGLQWFVKQVLPGLPELQVRAVGRGSAPTSERLEHVGFASDLQRHWDEAVAMVVPLLTGGGTRLKVLEAMAAGVPVVSTPLGVAGLGAVDGTHYKEAATASQMESALRYLLQDREVRVGLSAKAHEFVAANYEWHRCLAPLVMAVTDS